MGKRKTLHKWHTKLCVSVCKKNINESFHIFFLVGFQKNEYTVLLIPIFLLSLCCLERESETCHILFHFGDYTKNKKNFNVSTDINSETVNVPLCLD